MASSIVFENYNLAGPETLYWMRLYKGEETKFLWLLGTLPECGYNAHTFKDWLIGTLLEEGGRFDDEHGEWILERAGDGTVHHRWGNFEAAMPADFMEALHNATFKEIKRYDENWNVQG